MNKNYGRTPKKVKINKEIQKNHIKRLVEKFNYQIKNK